MLGSEKRTPSAPPSALLSGSTRRSSLLYPLELFYADHISRFSCFCCCRHIWFPRCPRARAPVPDENPFIVLSASLSSPLSAFSDSTAASFACSAAFKSESARAKASFTSLSATVIHLGSDCSFVASSLSFSLPSTSDRVFFSSFASISTSP